MAEIKKSFDMDQLDEIRLHLDQFIGALGAKGIDVDEVRRVLAFFALGPGDLLEGLKVGGPYVAVRSGLWYVHIAQPHEWTVDYVDAGFLGTSDGKAAYWVDVSDEKRHRAISKAMDVVGRVYAKRLTEWYLARSEWEEIKF